MHSACMDVADLTKAQAEQALLPHRHGGMGLRHYTADVADAARLSSAALAQCALVDGVERGRPFRGSAAVELQGVLDRLRATWGHAIADLGAGPADAAAWALDATAKLRLTQLQRAISRAEADGRKAAMFAALFTAGSGRTSQFTEDGQAAAARLRSCMGAMASAWLTALPGPVTACTCPTWSSACTRGSGSGKSSCPVSAATMTHPLNAPVAAVMRPVRTRSSASRCGVPSWPATISSWRHGAASWHAAGSRQRSSLT